jgi:excisionase family DNA binding protein
MENAMMSAKEVASYLGIHEKQVYLLVKAGRLPGTRITGKWVFPKRLVDERLEEDARQGLSSARTKGDGHPGALLAAGSNDPALDILLSSYRTASPGQYVFSCSTGSGEGLAALDAGYTDIAWSHLYDPESNDWNIPYLAERLPRRQPVVVNLFGRDLGFLLPRGNPKGIRGWADLARQDVRIINRQHGSGTRVLLDQRLATEGIEAEQVNGYGTEVSTHYEVGLAVMADEADTGLATGSIARLLGLDFVPAAAERFDMITDREVFFKRGVQSLLEMLRSESYGRRIGRLGHYDFSQSGKVLFPA